MSKLGPFLRDARERITTSALWGLLLAAGGQGADVVDDSIWVTLAATAGGALLSTLKALVARRIGDPRSASLDPEVRYGRHAI